MEKTKFIQSFKKARYSEKDKEILAYCGQKKVLDVGCVGQERSYDNPTWLHNQIRQTSNSLIGVDIDIAGIKVLNEKGFQVIHIDELSESDTYDTIVMGDVIEHISDIASFLNFYRKYLSPEGRMVITTPNPFSFRQVLHTLLYSKPSINGEHTCHLDPITMLEVVAREEFVIQDFCWLREQKKMTSLKNRIINLVASVFIRIRKFYSQNFMIVLSNPPSK